MPQLATIDRATASKINPLISPVSTKDTLCCVGAVVYEVGFLTADSALAKDHLYLVFAALSAAIHWEADHV